MKRLKTGTIYLLIFLTNLLIAFPIDLYAQSADTAPPELVNIQFAPTVIDTSGGEQVITLTCTATDNISGIHSIELKFTSPSGQQGRFIFFNPSDIISGDKNNGVFQTTAIFPQYSETGTWQISYIHLLDEVGNNILILTEDLVASGFPTELGVIGTADTAPPELVNIQFAPTVIDTSGGEQVITLTCTATDNISGIHSIELKFTSPSGQQGRFIFFNPSDIISGDKNNGVFQTTAIFPQYSETGTWQINYIHLLDEVGNNILILTEDLVASGFPTELGVILKICAKNGDPL